MMGEASANSPVRGCRCSILDTREEKLLDERGQIQLRLICNRCGDILDIEFLSPEFPSQHARRKAAPAIENSSAAEGAG